LPSVSLSLASTGTHTEGVLTPRLLRLRPCRIRMRLPGRCLSLHNLTVTSGPTNLVRYVGANLLCRFHPKNYEGGQALVRVKALINLSYLRRLQTSSRTTSPRPMRSCGLWLALTSCWET
jgi:hypothetical protein